MADTTTMRGLVAVVRNCPMLARDDFGHGVGGILLSLLCEVRVRGEGSGRTREYLKVASAAASPSCPQNVNVC